MASDRKIIFIGLDGVPWDVVQNSRAFTAIKRIAERGRWGRPKSVPPSTFPGWTTLTSGVNPGKHGLFEFTSFKVVDGEVTTRINTSLDIMYPRIHEILTLKRLRSIVMNLSPSFPPIPINGVLISDWLSPRKFVWPREMSWLADMYVEKPFLARGEGFIKGVERSVKSKVEIAKALFEDEMWTLFLMIFSEPDWLMHRYYADIVASRGRPTKALSYISDFVRWVEKRMPANSVLVIASDHGMGTGEFIVRPNVVLANAGILKVKMGGPGEKPFKSAIELLHSKQYVGQSTPRGSISSFLASLLPHRLIRAVPRRLALKLSWVFGLHYTPVIDCSSSRAFMPDDFTYGIYINEATASFSYSRALVKIFARAFEKGALSWPFELLAPREEVYRGPFVRRAPHVVLVPRRGFELSSSLLGQPLEPMRVVGHTVDAILVFYGDDVRSDGAELKNVNMCDVAPTLLYYLSLPVPEDADGQVLIDVFREEAVDQKLRRANYLTVWRAWRKARALRGRKP